MGMISRVRARLQSLHSLTTRIDPKIQDERTAQTVTLLSVLLLLPYFITQLEPSVLLSSVGLAYSCLVLPMISAANYKYTVSVLRSSLSAFLGSAFVWTSALHRVLLRTYANIERGERVYIKMTNVSMTINQLIVLMLCERVLLPADRRLTSLYSLMFFNVLTYCFKYMGDQLTKGNWSNINIVLEWTRAVTFVITIVTILLIFGLNQGLEHTHPTTCYLFVTGLYFIMTEKTFSRVLPSMLTYGRFELLESLEHVWAQVLLKSGTAIIAAVFSALGIACGQWKLSAYTLYTCVWLRLKDLHGEEMATLQQHWSMLARYRFATQEELDEHDDVCAVCLCPMRFARITPCQHVFHGDCLRRCLQASDLCPLCKRQFKFE